MADALTQARAAGYTDEEIFAHLTKGREKELEQARAAGYNDTQILNFFLGKGDEQVTGVPDAELRDRRVAAARERSARENLLDEAENDPARNASTLENLAAGFGKAFVDTGRGLKQIGAQVADAVAPREMTIADLVAERDPSRTAAVTRQIDESRQIDQPLMRTGAGMVGNVAGNVAEAVPLAFVPGANTIAGGATIGALMGGTQPVATGESRGQNTLTGAALGAAGPILARTAGAGYRAAKAFAEPFTSAGRDRIAGRTLQRFGINAADVEGTTNAPTVTGARLPLAEQIQRPEGAAAAARLQDNIRAANPEVAAQMAAREGENNAARVATLERLASPRDAAVAARQQATSGLYQGANAGTFQPTTEFAALAERPVVKAALAKAQSNLADAGATAAPNSIELLHQTKLAIDDAISTLRAGKPSASANAEISAAMKAQKDLLKFIETQAPDYAKARSTYAAMSKPVNQADIAEEILRRGSANTTDLSGTPRLMPNSLTGAVRDPAKLIKQATGRDLGAKLEDVLEPDQLAAVNAVVGEVDRAAAVARAGAGPGSATAQRLAGQNIVEQTLSRTGLPASAANSITLQEVLARPLNFLFKGAAEPKLQMTLGEVLLDPQAANRVMAAIAPPQRAALANVLSNRLLKQAARASLPAAAVANRR